jgi:acetylglutamate kinase
MDGLITEAALLSEELGAVGKPVRSDARLLDLLLDSGYLPVIACVAGDRQGRFYNVNADQMAASVASAIQADKLLFLTDVEGVRGRENLVYPTIHAEECEKLIRTQIATGGMQAKLEAAIEALYAGVRDVVIAPGAAPGIIAQILAGERVGTRLIALESRVAQHD